MPAFRVGDRVFVDKPDVRSDVIFVVDEIRGNEYVVTFPLSSGRTLRITASEHQLRLASDHASADATVASAVGRRLVQGEAIRIVQGSRKDTEATVLLDDGEFVEIAVVMRVSRDFVEPIVDTT